MGFALFSSAQLAIAARDALQVPFPFPILLLKTLGCRIDWICVGCNPQEMVFDTEAKSVLHTEMAKKNLFVKRGELHLLLLLLSFYFSLVIDFWLSVFGCLDDLTYADNNYDCVRKFPFMLNIPGFNTC